MLVDSKRSKFEDYNRTQRVNEFNPAKETEYRGWSRLWMPGLYRDDQKRLLIIGDGVTEGMSFYYEELLGNDWCVHRLTGSISVTDKCYPDRIRFALTASRKTYDVICYTAAIIGNETSTGFDTAVRATVEEIKKTHPETKLILASHTMCDPAKRGKDTNTHIFGCNKAIEVMAADYSAQYVDLGNFSEKLLCDHLDNGVFFTDAGYKKLAFEVVKKFK